MPILHATDPTDGFMRPWGGLYSKGADSIIEDYNNFIKAIKPNVFSKTIVTSDAHLWSTYYLNRESKKFGQHMMLGTPDMKFSVNILDLNEKTDLYVLFKDDNDMWANIENCLTVPPESIEFINAEEEWFFKNLLLRMSKYHEGKYTPVMHRDEFFEGINPKKEDIAMTGVLTDWCVKDAIIGYLLRKFTVTVLTDLVYGLYNPNFPGGVSNWEELLEANPIMKEAVKTGQLKQMTSSEYLLNIS